MPYYRSVGEVPPKRHTRARGADGAIRYEELVGADGFSADSTLLYHRHVPAAIIDTRPLPPDPTTTGPDLESNHPLRRRHFRLPELPTTRAGDLLRGRLPVVGNQDVALSYAVGATPSPLYRNAIGDEILYVERGTATVETTLGPIDVAAGDYMVIPQGLIHRWVPDGEVAMLAIAAVGHVGPPRRYLSAHGQFLEHSPYCERDLRGPSTLPSPIDDDNPVDVVILHRDHTGRSTATLATFQQHPFDIVGWDGCLYPYALNISDFEPVTGRVHQPPPVHQVFEGPNFVVCNFVPRLVDYHPDAVPVPYYHANVDSDEVLFYCGGEYAARRGSSVGHGSLTLHPAGLTHGPNPSVYATATAGGHVDERAVMVDTFRPLGIHASALACEDTTYETAWTRPVPSDP